MQRMNGTQEITHSTIALLTDFGISDGYVGAMKGVIWSISPYARIIDISHHIAPQNIQQAAYVLLTTYRYMPHGTVFCVVVDPGVGSSRRPVAVKTKHYTFVGPDNGIFTYILKHLTAEEIVTLDDPKYHLSGVSTTFHGRDIFSPAAAYLSVDTPIENLGSPIHRLERVGYPYLHVNVTAINGEVLYIDRFGNCVSSIGHLTWDADDMLHFNPVFKATNDGGELRTFGVEACSVEINDIRLEPLALNYASAARGKPLALINSAGQLEVAVSQGNASEQLGIKIGDKVTLHFD